MIQIFTITVNHEKQKLWDKWINQAGKDKQTWRVKVITNKLAINGMCLCVYLCFTCLTWAIETGHRPSASDRHFKPLLPSPPCGLADNGNLIGGSTERVVVEVVLRGGLCGPSFVRNSSKRWPSYLSSGALCNGILHCHFAPFIFRQSYYCSHTPHIPLGFVCRDRVRF